MPFVEMQPGKAGAEFVRMSQMRGGHVVVSMSALVAKRNGLDKGSKCRVLADLDARPRLLRIVVDKAGSFGVRITKGGAAVVVVGKFSGLEKVKFERSDVEFDECQDDKGKAAIDIELPAALQPAPPQPVTRRTSLEAEIMGAEATKRRF